MWAHHQPSHQEEVQTTFLVHGSVHVEREGDIPWTLEIPEELAYEGLTQLHPGYGGIKRSSRGERHANAVGGRATVSFDPARLSESWREDLSDAQALHIKAGSLVLQDVRETLAFTKRIPNAKRIDTSRVVHSAHSMGGYAATEVGLQDPASTEAVIYKGSAGFGHVNPLEIKPLRLLGEIVDYCVSNEIEFSPRHLYSILRYYGRSPFRTAGEALWCVAYDMRPRVAMLGEAGIAGAYLAFGDDSIIPATKAVRNAKGFVDLIHTMPGYGHLAPQRHPYAVAEATFDLQQQLTRSGPPALRSA